jgi:hypothetical protein
LPGPQDPPRDAIAGDDHEGVAGRIEDLIASPAVEVRGRDLGPGGGRRRQRPEPTPGAGSITRTPSP